MPPERGTVVCSGAGRDKGKYMVVLSADEDFVLLSTERNAHLSVPKEKNIKHIFPTTVCLTEEMMKNQQIAEACFA